MMTACSDAPIGDLWRALAGFLEVFDRTLGQPSLGQVVCHQLRMRFDNFRKVLFQHIGDLPVELKALAVQHTRVGSFLHECMLKDIGRIWWLTSGKDQFRCAKLSERRLQWNAGGRCDGGEQAIREFTPERGTDLCNLLDGAEPIETGDQ